MPINSCARAALTTARAARGIGSVFRDREPGGRRARFLLVGEDATGELASDVRAVSI